MHASEHTYNQTCTCLCSTIKPPEYKQRGKPGEMEEERGEGWGGAEDKGRGSRKKERDGEIKAVLKAVLKIQDVRFIVSQVMIEADD